MKIAILAWGSLIWDPGTLEYDRKLGWSSSGPVLPIEFARISKDGRLTLVITGNGTLVQTFYAISCYADLKSAIVNIKDREGTTEKNIGYFIKSDNIVFPTDFPYAENISRWAGNLNIEAVIWTNLPEKWQAVTEDRIDYLKNLPTEKKANAKKYIINTPKEITTKLRTEIEKELEWS